MESLALRAHSCSPHLLRFSLHAQRSTPTQMERDFLQIPDFSRDEINSLFDIADRMKAGKYKKRPLEGKSLAMIFMKSSTRTRVSFEVGTYQLGGHALFLDRKSTRLNSSHRCI